MMGRSLLKIGKSSGGGDELVAEMLLQLPACIVYIVHCLFIARYHGYLGGEPPTWRSIALNFLQK
eukprot:6496130-Karenia_brevis.AAC.1